MKFEDNKNITNVVLISTVVEVARNVIRNLDGRGLIVSPDQTSFSDDVLYQQIASRVNYNLKR